MTSLNPLLIKELQTAPEQMQQEVLNYLLFIKVRQRPEGEISRVPGVCGGDACVAGTRIPVWSLEQARRLGFSDERLLSNYPTLRSADLAAAWKYVRENPGEIEKSITLNEGILITERDPWDACEDACAELSESFFGVMERRNKTLFLASS